MNLLKISLILLLQSCVAKQAVITMYLNKSNGSSTRIGTITAQDTDAGMILKPDLQKLTPGIYSLYLHTQAKCAVAAKDIANRFNPDKISSYVKVYSMGYLSGLPNIIVTSDGRASISAMTVKFRVADILNHSLVMYNNLDYFLHKDLKTTKLNLACGVVPLKSHYERHKDQIPSINVVKAYLNPQP